MSKQYQIYGMGNALVDYEIETTAQELQSLGIDKGVMTLIEEETQEKLFHAFHGKHHSRACGGSAANTIIGAQSLGSACFYSCKVAEDDSGHFYRDDLTRHGVGSNLSYESLEPGKTGKCLVMVSEDADRTMNTFLGITGDIDYSQINEEALLNSEYLYIEGYLASSPIALGAAVEAMAFARENGIKTAFSLSDPNMVRFCREGLNRIIGDGVDLLFCNLEEALMYAESDNIEDAADKLSQLTNRLVITLGKEGALIISQGKRLNIKGNQVKAVDTNGAGDLFAGSFLFALCAGYSVEVSGQLASYASAQLVTQYGPRLSDSILKKVKKYLTELS